MSFEEIEITTETMIFAAKRWGNPNGAPVLGLHGWLDNAATFDRLAPFLADYNFIALDLAGHGRSGHRPTGMKYHYMDYIDDVTAVVDALSWDTFYLLGHSLGGGVSTIFSGTFPERVRGLILIEAVGPKTYPNEESPDYLAASIKQLRRLRGKKAPVYKSLDDIILARTKVTSLDFESTRLIIERSVKKVGSGYTWQSDPRLKIKSPSYATEEQIRAFLSRITAETLLIRGTDGSLVTRAEMISRIEKVSRLRQTTVEGGHHLHLQNPEPTAKAIIAFLAEMSAGNPAI